MTAVYTITAPNGGGIKYYVQCIYSGIFKKYIFCFLLFFKPLKYIEEKNLNGDKKP